MSLVPNEGAMVEERVKKEVLDLRDASSIPIWASLGRSDRG